MVIEDFRNRAQGSSRNASTHGRGSWALAHPYDRVAAAVVDMMVVLTPMIVFVVAPLKRRMMEALVLLDTRLFGFNVTAAVAVALLVILVYFAWFTVRFGASLGQLLFGLRVVDIWHTDRSPHWGQALLRSAVMIGEGLLLGIPWLAIFADVRRRPWHDRLSDTCVINVRGRSVAGPGVIEASVVRGFFAAILVFTLAMMGVGLNEQLAAPDEGLRALVDDEGGLCAAVGDAMESWSLKGVEKESRLSMAMALYAAGQVNKSCLTEEVDHLLNHHSEQTALTYLALAFVHADRPTLSNEYLDKVCEVEPVSDSCRMSRIVVEWSEENWAKVDEIFQSVTDPSQIHLSVWGVRHFMKHGRFKDALRLMESLGPQPALASFFHSQRTKALWEMGQESEARVSFNDAMDAFEAADRVDLASWMCLNEMDNDCTGVHQLSCKVMDEITKDSEEVMEDPVIALGEIRRAECEGPQSNHLAALPDRLPSGHLKSFAEALIHRAQGENEKALGELQKLNKEKNLDEEIQKVVQLKMLEWESDPGKLRAYTLQWMSETAPKQDMKSGRFLFRGLLKVRAYAESLAVGEKLVSSGWADASTLRGMVQAAYHVGQRRVAWKHLNSYVERFRGGWDNMEREPASNDEWRQVTRSLRKEFGKL